VHRRAVIFETVINIITESWKVLAQMSPYLLFGFLIAGILSIYLSPRWVERHLGGHGFSPILKASLFGVPLPLCSCGVIPVSASIHKHGAGKPATTAFLLSTPQTGIDSIAVTYALLGPIFAIFRPITALVSGLIGGFLVQAFDKKEVTKSTSQNDNDRCTNECCSATKKKHRIWLALEHGFITLPRDIGKALLLGVLIAGIIAGLIKPNQLETILGSGVISILLLMAAGVPLYVCATASVPIAAGFIYMGASPGAALAFLIAGPATNAATFTTLWKVLGKRTALLYLLTVALSAVGFGLLLNLIVPWAETAIPFAAGQAHHHEQLSLWSHAAAIVLLAVVGISIYGRKSENRPLTKPQETTTTEPHKSLTQNGEPHEQHTL
jgi:uncharacterized membrane protein YraQ (UPF0718 family)